MAIVAPFTDAEKTMLFPFTSCRGDSVERAAFRLTRLLRHNRRMLMKYEEPLIRLACALWCEVAAPYFGAGHVEPDDTFEIVRDGWERARFPLGDNPILDAAERAIAEPSFPAAPPKYGAVHALVFRTLYNLNCAAVRNNSPDFFASSHHVAHLLGLRQCLVYRAFKRMERDGILHVKTPGTPHKATRFDVFLPLEKV